MLARPPRAGVTHAAESYNPRSTLPSGPLRFTPNPANVCVRMSASPRDAPAAGRRISSSVAEGGDKDDWKQVAVPASEGGEQIQNVHASHAAQHLDASDKTQTRKKPQAGSLQQDKQAGTGFYEIDVNTGHEALCNAAGQPVPILPQPISLQTIVRYELPSHVLTMLDLVSTLAEQWESLTLGPPKTRPVAFPFWVCGFVY